MAWRCRSDGVADTRTACANLRLGRLISTQDGHQARAFGRVMGAGAPGIAAEKARLHDAIRPQGRPCLMFSLDYGDIYEGERNVELCTGVACSEEASRREVFDLARARSTPGRKLGPQLQVNRRF